MADELGLLAGAKSVAEAHKTGKEAGNQLGDVIRDAQKETVDLAKQRARERIQAKLAEERRRNLAVVQALQEYQRRRAAAEEEARLKSDFIKRFGATEWTKVLQLKAEIEKADKKERALFDEELSKIRKVMAACYFVAAWIAWYIVWGSKK